MKINPTYGVANKLITTLLVSRDRLFDSVTLPSILIFVLVKTFTATFVVFAVLWALVFVLTFKDSQYFSILWRSFRRQPMSSPWRASGSIRGRLSRGLKRG